MELLTRRTLRGLAGLVLVFSLTACGIEDPSQVKLEISPGGATMAVGETLKLVAYANYMGRIENVSSVVEWSSTSPGVATVSQGGMVEALATGYTDITVEYSGVTASIDIAVAGGSLLYITVSPGIASIINGQSLEYTAIGNFSDGSYFDITNTLSWYTSDSEVAVANRAGGTVTVTATGWGVANIVAREPSKGISSDDQGGRSGLLLVSDQSEAWRQLRREVDEGADGRADSVTYFSYYPTGRPAYIVEDLDADGSADTITYQEYDHLLRQVLWMNDTDADRRYDIVHDVFWAPSGYQDRVEMRDGDGTLFAIYTYERGGPGGKERHEIDYGVVDGIIDAITYYTYQAFPKASRRVTLREWDGGADGIIDQADIYEYNDIGQMEYYGNDLDGDRDGVIAAHYEYRYYYEGSYMTKMEYDSDTDGSPELTVLYAYAFTPEGNLESLSADRGADGTVDVVTTYYWGR